MASQSGLTLQMYNKTKSPSQQKLAEKLLILNERAEGLLTRLHYSKQSCEEARTCPPCLTEKGYEGLVKSINSKFLKLDRARNSLQGMNLGNATKNEIRQHLQVHYNTFVDILELKQCTMELLTRISADAMSFDINLNFSLTANFLDLLTRYVKLMLLIQRHEQVKAIVGFYTIIYEPNCGEADPTNTFHRLSNMIVSCDTPLKMLVDEILPLSLRVGVALKSLHPLHEAKNKHASKMHDEPNYKIVSLQGLTDLPYTADDPGCRLISLDKLNEWILFGYLVCPSQITASDQRSWKNALGDCYIITLFRDETVNIHSLYLEVFERNKANKKLVAQVQDAATVFVREAPLKHAQRRNFFRKLLQDITNIVTSSPGLIAPKLILILDIMSQATGEVHWLVRNYATDWRKHKVRVSQDMFDDPCIAQLLFAIDSLARLIRYYRAIVKKYYLQFLKQNDSVVLRDLMTNFPAPEEESRIFTAVIDTLHSLNTASLDTEEDFTALRVDWQRLQAYTSVNQSQLQLRNYDRMAAAMNVVEFHSRSVDDLDGLLREVTGLSNLCFYMKFIQESFQKCLDDVESAPYSIVFASVCAHFIDTCNEYCPEEHCFIGKKSIDLANHFLDKAAKEGLAYLELYCRERMEQHMRTHPSYGARLMAEARNNKEREAKRERPAPPLPLPGDESKKTRLEEKTAMEKNFTMMVSHMQALNTLSSLVVWQHTFAPREYIIHHLDELFARLVSQAIFVDAGNTTVRLPSMMLHYLTGLMDIFRQLESFVTLDTSRTFNVTLLQHTQPEENTPGRTFATRYTEWYLDQLEAHLRNGEICYAPIRQAFIRKHQMAPNFNAELYTNIGELQALTKLLGPYGIKYMGDKLMERCEKSIHRMLTIVKENKELLIQLNACTIDDFPTAPLMKQLKHHEEFTSECAVVGALFTFRKLTLSALKSVVGLRAPYLQNCIHDFYKNAPAECDNTIVEEMAIAAGIETGVDAALCSAIQRHCMTVASGSLWELFNVMAAVALPLQSTQPLANFKPQIEGHENNLHCVTLAIAWLTAAVHTNLVRTSGTTSEAIRKSLREFLEKLSERMMKLLLDEDKELQKELKQRESMFVLLEAMVQNSPYVSYDMLENNFPFTMVRNSYRALYETKKKKKTVEHEM